MPLSLRHYALTAAHVYKDLGNEFSIGIPGHPLPTKVQAYPKFNTIGEKEGDIGLLIIDQANPLLCEIQNVDTRAANTTPEQGKYSPFKPCAINEEDLEA